MKTLIRGGRLIDPTNGHSGEILDLLLIDGKIACIGVGISASDARVIDASGFFVAPGLVDMHTHLREPGQEHKETIRTGTKAAARGGFTSVAAMANTQPVADSPQVIHSVINRAKSDGIINVFPISSVTLGLRGEELVNVEQVVAAGAVAMSDDGKPVKNPEIMKRALTACKKYGISVISHCEHIEKSYVDWVMNAGETALRLGLPGLPNSAEERGVERNIKLAEETGGHLHIAHVSTAGSVELIRRAKAKGVNVTAEATPHHFTLTDAAVEKHGANAKMNPPLRSQKDVDAVIAGLRDGTIDAIATDHAPHTPAEKSLGMAKAPCGVVGLETCLPLVITQLVNKGHLSIYEAIAKMTANPARILNLGKGTLSEGADADITIIDVEKEQIVDAAKFESKGRNTPFDGLNLKGWAIITIVAGEVVFSTALAGDH